MEDEKEEQGEDYDDWGNYTGFWGQFRSKEDWLYGIFANDEEIKESEEEET